MNFPLLIGLLGSFAVVIGGSAALYQRIDQPAEWDRTRVLREQYQMFFTGAYLYMQTTPKCSPEPCSVNWQTIVSALQSSSQMPPAASANAMPSNWMLRYRANGEWWTCTEMNEKAISAVAALVPPDLASRYTPTSSAGTVSEVRFPDAAGSSASLTMTCP